MFLILTKWLLSSAFTWALSLIIWRRVRGLGLTVDILSLFLLQSLLVSAAVMLTGLAGLLTANGLFGCAVLGWLGVALFGRHELRKAFRPLLRSFRAVRSAIARRPLQAALLTGVFALLLTRMAAHVWFLPPSYVFDVNTYHLPRVAGWIQQANLTVPHYPVKRIFWPAGFELIQTWWAVFPHHDAVIEAAGVPFWAMAIGAVFVLARRLGVSRLTAAWCSLLFAFTPALALNATSGKNDIAVAALYLYLAALWAKPLDRRLVGKRWLLTFVAALLGIGMKPTMVFILPGLAWMAATGFRTKDIACFRRVRLSPWAGTLLILALLLGGYWYTRNWIQFKNPFYPTSFHVADQLVVGAGAGSGQQGAFSLDSIAANVTMLWKEKIFDGVMPYNPDLCGMTGWGWFVFVCGSSCLIWGVIINRRLRWQALSFVTSFLLLLGWVTPDPWNMRFAQWFPALAALGFGVTIQDRTLITFVRYSMILLAIWTTTLNGLGILGNGYTPLKRWVDFIKMPVSQRAPDDSEGAVPQSSLEQRIPPGEPLIIIGIGDDPFYPLYGPGFTRRLIYPDDRSRGYATAMREHGSRRLYFPPYIPDRDQLTQELEAHQLEAMGRNVYRLVEEGKE